MRGEQALRRAREHAEALRSTAARAALRDAASAVSSGMPALLRLLAPGGVHRAWSAALLRRVVAEAEHLGLRAQSSWAAGARSGVLPSARALGLADGAEVLAAMDRAYLGRRWKALWQLPRPPVPGRPAVDLPASPGYPRALSGRVGDALAGLAAGTPLERARAEVERATRAAAKSLAWIPVRDGRYLASAEYNRAVIDVLASHDRPGSRVYKRLVATHDKRTGKDSVALDGQTVPLDQPFVDVWYGGTYPYPPNRYNDREVVTPWRDLYGPPPSWRPPSPGTATPARAGP